MSSVYRLICLSHDPGLELDTEWHSGSDGRRTAEEVLRQLVHGGVRPARGEGQDELLDHAGCDLVIGEYSSPLVEVGYLPYNTNVHWIDIEWVRVLAASVILHDRQGNQIPPFPRGWTAERVRRLVPHLRMPERIDA
ncbi:MAG TPA: hypothetical protein VFQ42_04215 [Mycobacterium sp.]|nr:hypothetical protein [Mycobacterium sp.]